MIHLDVIAGVELAQDLIRKLSQNLAKRVESDIVGLAPLLSTAAICLHDKGSPWIRDNLQELLRAMSVAEEVVISDQQISPAKERICLPMARLHTASSSNVRRDMHVSVGNRILIVAPL